MHVCIALFLLQFCLRGEDPIGESAKQNDWPTPELQHPTGESGKGLCKPNGAGSQFLVLAKRRARRTVDMQGLKHLQRRPCADSN